MANFEDRNDRKTPMKRFQVIQHLGMGAFYLIAGSLVLYVKYFGTMELPTGLAYFLGIMMLLYGIFRIWRGFAELKNLKHNN